jgi:hypothetical protein
MQTVMNNKHTFVFPVNLNDLRIRVLLTPGKSNMIPSCWNCEENQIIFDFLMKHLGQAEFIYTLFTLEYIYLYIFSMCLSLKVTSEL